MIETGDRMSIYPKVLAALPIHAGSAFREGQNHVLRVDGLVAKALDLTVSNLEVLPQEDLIDDFTCLEGWKVPGLKWSGAGLESVLALVQPEAGVRFIQASAGDFSICLPREQAKDALLAMRLNDGALPLEHGGPVRLVIRGGQCFTKIKWLDHLELRADPGQGTAKAIALGRLSSKSTP
jgi:DMSO/TMAO reductase YedYZ molybdopterin-dependent catalytic subunit